MAPSCTLLPAAEDGVSGPCLEAAHADGGEVVHLALVLDLHAALVVLPRRQKERPVHQRVPAIVEIFDTDFRESQSGWENMAKQDQGRAWQNS